MKVATIGRTECLTQDGEHMITYQVLLSIIMVHKQYTYFRNTIEDIGILRAVTAAIQYVLLYGIIENNSYIQGERAHVGLTSGYRRVRVIRNIQDAA